MITEELKFEKDRIRTLIGTAHWQTDGEHKESVLRRVIRNHTPEIFRIGRGFVCYPSEGGSSSQIDILITPLSAHTLYRQDGLVFVTPTAAKAIIEVKTRCRRSKKFEDSVDKLANMLERVRVNSSSLFPCWGGLFIYEKLDHQYILETLQTVCRNNPRRAINCVCAGSNQFIRFWPDGHSESGPKVPVWHSYEIPDLAAPYFIGNAIMDISPDTSEADVNSWFVIPNTKEEFKLSYAKLSGGGVIQF